MAIYGTVPPIDMTSVQRQVCQKIKAIECREPDKAMQEKGETSDYEGFPSGSLTQW